MDSTAPIERPSLAVQTSGLGKRFGPQAALDGVDPTRSFADLAV
jgi:hypothetical protein